MTAAMLPFGVLLRRWRQNRRLSQEALALATGSSTRHLSCLETARSQPSREMILRLSAAMDIPLRAAVDLGLCVTHEYWLFTRCAARSFGDGRLAGWPWREDDRRRTTEQ